GARPLDRSHDDGAPAGEGIPHPQAPRRRLPLCPARGRRRPHRRRRPVRRERAGWLALSLRRLPLRSRAYYRDGAARSGEGGGSIEEAEGALTMSLLRTCLEGGALAGLIAAACFLVPRMKASHKAMLW